MTDITILSLILGSATSFVGLVFAVMSFIKHGQKKAIQEDQEKRAITDLQERVKRLEKWREGQNERS
jgi:hypothetical protein